MGISLVRRTAVRFYSSHPPSCVRTVPSVYRLPTRAAVEKLILASRTISESVVVLLHEIRHRHSRRLCRRTARVAGRQDAAASGPQAEHGPHRPAGRGRPLEQRAAAADAGQRRGHAQPVRLRSAGRLHRPGAAGNRGDGHSARPRRLGHPLQSRPRREREDARLHGRPHHQRGRPAAHRGAASGAGRRRRDRTATVWNSTPASAIATSSSIALPPAPAPFADETKTQPPHDIPDRPIADYLPKGPGSDLLRELDGAAAGRSCASIR